jgi:hypothetical protein
MMRVAEIGLRALPRERGVSFPRHPIEWADWQNILEQTEAKAKDATRNMARGPAARAPPLPVRSIPGSGSLLTHRWREMESNHQYLAKFFRPPVDPRANSPSAI